MRAWYSGVIPYRVLLPVQILVCLVLSLMVLSVAAGVEPGALFNRLGKAFVWTSYLYLLFVVVRATKFLSAPASARPVFIPIPFHLVLMLFLWLYGSWLPEA